MAEPQAKPQPPQTSIEAKDWFKNAPIPDENLHDLFKTESDKTFVSEPAPVTEAPVETPAAPETPAPDAQPNAPQSQSATSQDDFTIRAGDTVYKSRDEVARGIEHKDAVISQLRNYVIQTQGVDPITGKQVGMPQFYRPTQGEPQANQPVNYAQDPDRYYQDLAEANESAQKTGDKRKFFAIQQKFFQDNLNASMGPVMPLVRDSARTRAIREVSTKLPEFDKLYGSKDWQETLDTKPTLRQAVTLAEHDVNLAQQLPEIYEVVYWATKGRQMPQLVQQAAAAAQQAAPPQGSQPRTTMQPMTPNPPKVQSSRTRDLLNPEDRKAYLKELKDRGVDQFVWRSGQ